MGFIYVHRIDATDLRNFCIRHNLFTCGDNKGYDKLFEDARGTGDYYNYKLCGDVDALHLKNVVDRIYVNSHLDDIQGFEGDTFDPKTIAAYLIAENVLRTYVYDIDD